MPCFAAGASLADRAEHERLLSAFLHTAQSGDRSLDRAPRADPALYTDGGPRGRTVGRIRNLQRPLVGAARVAAFIKATSSAVALSVEPHELDGRPALVFYSEGQPFGAVLLAIANGKIESIYFQGDLAKLRFLGRATLLS